jgi:hypothetical protein
VNVRISIGQPFGSAFTAQLKLLCCSSQRLPHAGYLLEQVLDGCLLLTIFIRLGFFPFLGCRRNVHTAQYEPTHTTLANSRIFRMLNFINKATYIGQCMLLPQRVVRHGFRPHFRQGGRESAGGDSRKSRTVGDFWFRASPDTPKTS